MTSGQESSDRARKPNKPPEIESLAGVFHPHAIEVQDFSHYSLVIDVRTPQEYEDDHIPGAVQFSPSVVSQGPLVTGHADDPARALVADDSGAEGELPPALKALVAPLKLDQAILVYCGRGGLDSLPVARALRWRGWTVDVLPGGWINYRRWVQAGLEVLPRMVSFRVIATSLGCEADRILNALASVGHQVLNVEALMVRRRGSIACRSALQPSQAWLESQLLQRLRAVDPRRPVWVGDVDAPVGELRVPPSLADTLNRAPIVVLEIPLEERVQRWKRDVSYCEGLPIPIWDTIAGGQTRPVSMSAASSDLLAVKEEIAALDRVYFARLDQSLPQRTRLPSIRSDSLEADRLAEAVRVWLTSTPE